MPELISNSEQEALKLQIKLEYRDRNFLETDGIDYIELNIPAYFNDREIGKVNLSLWDKDKLIYSAVLGEIGGRIRNRNLSRFEFTINRYSNLKPKLSIIYGDTCYKQHQLIVDNLLKFNIGFEAKKWEMSFERESSILLRKSGDAP